MARTRKIDFTGVESFSRCPEGIHTMKLVELTEATSQGGDDMLKVVFEVISGENKGCRVFDNFVMTDKALWKFKQYLTAVKVKCDGKVAIDLDKLVGKVCDVSVYHEEYNGQLRAKVQEYTKLVKNASSDEDEDESDEDEPEEKPAPKAEKVAPAPALAKSKKAPEPDPDDEDEDEDEDEDDEDETPPPPKKAAKAEPKPDPKAAAKKDEKPAKGKKPADDDDDDDDDWEDA
jgi:hypothetical protein